MMSTIAASHPALFAPAVRPATASPQPLSRALRCSQRRLAPPAFSQKWALSAAPTGVQPGGEMLEAQDAGGNPQEVGDTEFERNEEVPSNSPGNEVAASGMPGQSGTSTRQPAVEHAPGTTSGNQDDTGKSASKPLQNEANLETILEQEAPQGRAAGSPESIGEHVQRDVEGLVKEEGAKEEARFPGSSISQSPAQSPATADAPEPGEHREVPAGQRPTDPQKEPQQWEPPTTPHKIPLQEGTRIPGATS